MDASHQMTLWLAYRPPYAWQAIADFLGRRALPGVETVDGTGYRRAIRVGEARGTIHARHEDGHLEARIALDREAPAEPIVAGLRRLFDLDAEPAAIDARLAADPLLRASVAALPGVRLPGAWEPFELAVRAVLGQQVSVAGARTLAGRLVERFGERLPDGRLFPTPARLAEADIASVGLTRARAATIAGLARAVADGEPLLDGAAGLDAAIERLCRLPGIGPWTAHYIAMRGLGLADAFPAADLGLIKAAGGVTPAELEARAEAWRPWRGYAAIRLWTGGGGGG